MITLSWIVFKSTHGRPTLSTFFIAGALFGMFETYVTKEIWHPTWAKEITLYINGVAIVQTSIFILFFHNFFSFIIPLLLAESILTSIDSKVIFNCMPGRVRYIFNQRRYTSLVLLVILAVWGGIYSSKGARFPKIAFSGVIIAFLGISIAIWRHLLKKKEVTFKDMLPKDSGFILCASGVVICYLFGGFFIQKDYIPAWNHGQLFVWIIYILLIIVFTLDVLYARFRENHTNADESYALLASASDSLGEQGIEFSWPLVIILAAVFMGISMGFSFVPDVQIVIIGTLCAGVVLGGFMFAVALKEAYLGVRIVWQEKPWLNLE